MSSEFDRVANRDEAGAVRVENLSHSFGDVAVLDGVDLAVDPGEFVALVGPNGAGKTTLLRLLNGVLEPDSGTVTLGGTSTAALSAKAVSRQVATVPQDTHIGFSFTVEQLVEMGRTPHRSRLDWTSDTDPIERALERTETAQFRDRTVDELSGGQRQRVLLARALAQEAPTLLLDEPTASLDINHQVQMLSLVEELVDEGKAALAAIHDLDLAARYCDRLLLLSDGEIRARGSPEDVLADESLSAAFGTKTAVTQNPATGTPTVAAFTERPPADGNVHIAGGGESSVRALRTLWQAGFDVSIGPVPEGDTTATLADQLDCPAVTAPPFSPVSGKNREAAIALARAADVVVLSSGPGSGVVADEATEPRIRARLDESGGAKRATAAMGDGGPEPTATDRVVESEQALLTAVRECVEAVEEGGV